MEKSRVLEIQAHFARQARFKEAVVFPRGEDSASVAVISEFEDYAHMQMYSVYFTGRKGELDIYIHGNTAVAYASEFGSLTVVK